VYDDDDDDGDGDGDVLLSCSYDSDRDKFLGVDDLAKMMKKIKSSPVELSGLDEMIREVDEDGDGKLSLREVLIVTFGAAVILPDLRYGKFLATRPLWGQACYPEMADANADRSISVLRGFRGSHPVTLVVSLTDSPTHLLTHLAAHLYYHHHSHHPSLLHSFTPGSKPTFSTNPSHFSFLPT